MFMINEESEHQGDGTTKEQEGSSANQLETIEDHNCS